MSYQTKFLFSTFLGVPPTRNILEETRSLLKQGEMEEGLMTSEDLKNLKLAKDLAKACYEICMWLPLALHHTNLIFSRAFYANKSSIKEALVVST